MRNSMSFSTTDLAKLMETSAKKSKSTNGKNAQFYKARLEAHVSELASSDERLVRLAVVSSLNASSTCLKSILACEIDEEIIGIILTHPNLSKTVKTEYVRQNKDLVQSIIESANDQTITEDQVSEALEA